MPDRAWQGSLLYGYASSILAFLRTGRVRKLDHPASLTTRVILFETHALVATGETIIDADNFEFILGDAHIDISGPPPSSSGILGIKIIVSRLQFPLDQSSAGGSRNLPPSLGIPTILGTITYCHSDKILRAITHAEICMGRRSHEKRCASTNGKSTRRNGKERTKINFNRFYRHGFRQDSMVIVEALSRAQRAESQRSCGRLRRPAAAPVKNCRIPLCGLAFYQSRGSALARNRASCDHHATKIIA